MLDPFCHKTYFIDTNETKASGTYVLHLHKYYDAIIYYTKLANWPSLLGIVNQEVYLDEQYEEREEEVSSAIKMAATATESVATHDLDICFKT